MRPVLAALAILAVAAAAAQLEPAPRPGYVQWTYTDEQLSRGQVVVFSVCIDSAPCNQVDPAAARTAIGGWYEWKLPALLAGEHVVTVQGCNPIECSGATAAKFTVRIVPEAPAIVRVGGTPGGAP